MKKILFVAPHLSTGGLPQYLYKKITILQGVLEVFCIEYQDVTGGQFVVQRNKIINFLDKNHFFTLGDNKFEEIKNIIEKIKPDFIHLEEIPEFFMQKEIADFIYSVERLYKLFETSHDSSFDPDQNKRYFPDAFFFVSQWQINQYKNINIPKYLAEYPIEFKQRPNRDEGLKKLGLDPSKKHVLNIGLFTSRKNQAEIFKMAEEFDSNCQFHFVGNQADNFRDYWQPLLSSKPSNCVIWGERSDTDNFYSCMDLFLFTSKGNNYDKETMPLVLREALSWNMSIFLYNLDVYLNYFDKFNNITYLDSDINKNIELIYEFLKLENNLPYFSIKYNPEDSKISFVVKRDHPKFKKFGVRMRDSLTKLIFNTIYYDFPFKKGFEFWMQPNATRDYRNGILVEFFDENKNIIQENDFLDGARTTWKPNIFPTTEIFVNDQKIDISCDPFDHSSFWSFYEIFIREDYKNIEPNDIVVDVGANLGFFSLYSAKMGAKKIYSIEPVKKTFDYLKSNTQLVPAIECYNIGFGSNDGETEFNVGVVSSISGKVEYTDPIDHDWGYEKHIEKVYLKNPNSFFKENNIEYIDYLKIDCEGAELDFFRALDSDFLKHKIKKICGEIHINSIGEDGYKEIKNILEGSGFLIKENLHEDKKLSNFYAERKPKIKILHLLNDVSGDREQQSIESLKKLASFGFEYEQIVTEKFFGIPPKDNCNRESSVSETPGDYLLTGAHYGCYSSHKNAITNNYIQDYDAVLICECDCLMFGEYKELYEKIIDTYFLNNKYNLIYTSFGKQIPGEVHENLQNDLYSTLRQSEAHCYLVSKIHIKEFSDVLNNSKWDAFDLWCNVFLINKKRGIYKIPYALQCAGFSSIDLRFKLGNDVDPNTPIYRPNEIDKDISIIVQTCDNYERFWEGWYLSFQRYWNWNLKWPIYFCVENKDPKFSDNRILILHSPHSDNSRGFSNRLLNILDQINTKYVLYMQEDMWPILPVKYDLFKKALFKIRNNDWNCIRIHEKLWGSYEFLKTNQFVDGIRILRAKNNSEWLLSHNACIWNKEFLKSIINEEEDPWKNEILGTVRIAKKYVDPKIFHINERWYYQPGASQGGNFNPSMEEYQRYLQYSKNLNSEFNIY